MGGTSKSSSPKAKDAYRSGPSRNIFSSFASHLTELSNWCTTAQETHPGLSPERGNTQMASGPSRLLLFVSSTNQSPSTSDFLVLAAQQDRFQHRTESRRNQKSKIRQRERASGKSASSDEDAESDLRSSTLLCIIWSELVCRSVRCRLLLSEATQVHFLCVDDMRWQPVVVPSGCTPLPCCVWTKEPPVSTSRLPSQSAPFRLRSKILAPVLSKPPHPSPLTAPIPKAPVSTQENPLLLTNNLCASSKFLPDIGAGLLRLQGGPRPSLPTASAPSPPFSP